MYVKTRDVVQLQLISMQVYLWDYRYYDRLYIEQSLDLDDALVKEYFPVSVVVKTILDIYQTLLSVQFVPLEGHGEAWHPGEFLLLTSFDLR